MQIIDDFVAAVQDHIEDPVRYDWFTHPTQVTLNLDMIG